MINNFTAASRATRSTPAAATNHILPLKSDPVIKEFLPRVVAYLKDNPQHGGQVFHYLTGRADSLTLNIGNIPSLSARVTTAMNNLLPINRNSHWLLNLFSASDNSWVNTQEIITKLESICLELNSENARSEPSVFFNQEQVVPPPLPNYVEQQVHSPGEKYSGARVNGKAHGQGSLLTADGMQYIGEFKNGRISGKGVMTRPNGEQLIGDFENGNLHGSGVHLGRGGQFIYAGEWKNGLAHGQGVGLSPGGGSFIGSWQDGVPHTHGVYVQLHSVAYSYDPANPPVIDKVLHALINNGIYTGDIVNGKPHGAGSITYPEFTYTGEFIEGRPIGLGLITDAKGDKYIGGCVDCLPDGFGIAQLQGRGLHVGDWVRAQKQGRGISTYADGSYYEGDWVADLRHGSGKYTAADGSQYIGEWANDKKHGRGTFIKPNGTIYKGVWQDGKLNGQGSIVFPDGGSYEGGLRNGVQSGQGVRLYPDGGRHVGDWAAGRPNGLGTYIFPDGSYYTDMWGNGRCERLDEKIIKGMLFRSLPTLSKSYLQNNSHYMTEINFLHLISIGR